MTLTEFFPLLTNSTLILIAIFTLFEYYRNRRKGYLDVGLLFWGLGMISIINLTQTYLTGPVVWLSKVPSLLLVAHPYLLLRVVNHLRPAPTAIHVIGLIGMGMSILWIIALPLPLPPIIAVLIVMYFAFIEIYAAVSLIRGALTTSGVTHNRLLLAASGSILLAFVITIAGINAAVPAAVPFLSPISQLVALIAVLSYFFGFATPSWLLHSWQYGEFYRYINQRGTKRFSAPLETRLEHLCDSSARSVGGYVAAVAVNDHPETGGGYRIFYSTDPSHSRGTLIPEQSRIGKVFKAGKAAVIHMKGDLGQDDSSNRLSTGANSIYCVPLYKQKNIWGFLLVLLLHEPLFPDDDIGLLKLLAEQKSLILGYLDLLEEQKRYSFELEQKVRERTKELEAAVKELQKEIKARKEAAQELESFAYTVSHDLRAPLRAIDGFSQVLVKKIGPDLSGEAQGYFNRIVKNVQQMGQLIDDLLEFSRLGRSAMNVELVYPSEIVDTALKRLKHEIGARQIEIVVDELPPCLADPRLLTQVYINLISNSVKFTRGREKACIEIGCQKEKGEIIYFVKDNGAGFSMEYVDKLFGVFQRLHKSEDYEGTGVGLANIQRIIQRHGGRVWAEGAVDKGAAFYFSLPEEGRVEDTEEEKVEEAAPEAV
jgi:signal transduction histidine kinase